MPITLLAALRAAAIVLASPIAPALAIQMILKRPIILAAIDVHIEDAALRPSDGRRISLKNAERQAVHFKNPCSNKTSGTGTYDSYPKLAPIKHTLAAY